MGTQHRLMIGEYVLLRDYWRACTVHQISLGNAFTVNSCAYFALHYANKALEQANNSVLMQGRI